MWFFFGGGEGGEELKFGKLTPLVWLQFFLMRQIISTLPPIYTFVNLGNFFEIKFKCIRHLNNVCSIIFRFWPSKLKLRSIRKMLIVKSQEVLEKSKLKCVELDYIRLEGISWLVCFLRLQPILTPCDVLYYINIFLGS